MCEWWIKDTLPKNKETFSRDAVEILMKLAYEKGIKEGQASAARPLLIRLAHEEIRPDRQAARACDRSQ